MTVPLARAFLRGALCGVRVHAMLGSFHIYAFSSQVDILKPIMVLSFYLPFSFPFPRAAKPEGFILPCLMSTWTLVNFEPIAFPQFCVA